MVLASGIVVVGLWAWVASIAARHADRTWRLITAGALAVVLGSGIRAAVNLLGIWQALTATPPPILTSPNAILARLDEPLKLLKGGHRDAPERHRALERTLAWSWDLLGHDERRLFARLGVFAGGFTLDAAEAVSDADLDTLGSLVGKSLVRRDGDRYAMLETIRGYALDQLSTSGGEAVSRDRHATFFEQLAAVAHADPIAPQGERADELEREHDNLRAGLDRLGVTDPDRRLRMAGKLGWFWHAHSHLTEGRSRLAEALADRSERDEDRARAVGRRRPGRLPGPA